MRRWGVSSAMVGALAVGSVLVPAPAARADWVRDLLWHLDYMDMPAAWAVTKGAGVTVAVVDSGVDGSHPDLAGNVLAGTSFAGPGDGNTVLDDHGTAMAGLIAAHGRGDDGMLGVAPEAMILPVVEDDSSTGAKAIRWATDHGADVINCSFGTAGDVPTPELRKAIAYALSKDVVVVASAGNSGGAVDVPGAYGGVIGVAATTKTDTRTPLSAHGPEVDLAAPGEDIASTGPGDGYVNADDGTSTAAAIVSGVVALVRAAHPDLDAANVVNRVVTTARDVGAPGRDDDFGYGVVDPVAALTADVALVTESPLGSLDTAAGGSSPPVTTAPLSETNAPPSVPTESGSPTVTETAVTPGAIGSPCAAVDSSADCPSSAASADESNVGGVLGWGLAAVGVIAVGLAAWLVSRRRSVARSGADGGPRTASGNLP